MNPLFWLGLSILLVAVSITAVLMAALPAFQELSRAARSAEKLFDTLNRELPPTLEAIRLTSMEITELTDDMTEGMQNVGRMTQQMDQGVSGVKQQAKQAQITTRSVVAGFKAALSAFARPSSRRAAPVPTRPRLPVSQIEEIEEIEAIEEIDAVEAIEVVEELGGRGEYETNSVILSVEEHRIRAEKSRPEEEPSPVEADRTLEESIDLPEAYPGKPSSHHQPSPHNGNSHLPQRHPSPQLNGTPSVSPEITPLPVEREPVEREPVEREREPQS